MLYDLEDIQQSGVEDVFCKLSLADMRIALVVFILVGFFLLQRTDSWVNEWPCEIFGATFR